MPKTNLASIEASFKRTAQIVKTGSKAERAGRFLAEPVKKRRALALKAPSSHKKKK